MQLFISCNNLSNQTISIPLILQPKEKSLIVEQFNPILHRPCVHHGTFIKVLIDNFCSSKRREIIIFVLNYFENKTQTKQHFV